MSTVSFNWQSKPNIESPMGLAGEKFIYSEIHIANVPNDEKPMGVMAVAKSAVVLSTDKVPTYLGYAVLKWDNSVISHRIESLEQAKSIAESYFLDTLKDMQEVKIPEVVENNVSVELSTTSTPIEDIMNSINPANVQ